jgi:hypothetical protein
MKFQDLVSKIQESRGPKGSFDDSASEVKESVKDRITNEVYSTGQLVESIRKYSDKKVTDQLVERYHEAASSKEFSVDPVLLDLNRKSQFRFDDKYIFVIEDTVVALSEECINHIKDTQIEIKSISDIRTIVKERQ